MIRRIAQKEFIQALRDKRLRVVASLLVGLTVFAVWASWQYYQTAQQELRQASQDMRQAWEAQTLKNPHNAAHFGTYAFKPVALMSLVDNGLDKYLGVSVFLEAHKQNLPKFKQIADQNDLARFAELTPAFVLVYLFPLLIILFGFSIFSIEKEQGTLRLLLSQGVSGLQLGVGKMLGLGAVVLSLLAPCFIVGFVFLLVSPYQSSDIGAYLMLWVGLLLYYSIFIFATVGVSAWARQSQTALLTLLGFWIVSALLVPRLMVNVAKEASPTPTAIAFQKALQENLKKGIDGHNPFTERAKVFQDSVLKANKVDSIQKLPFNYAGLIMQVGEEHETVVYAKAFQKLYDHYQTQIRTHEATAFLSPTTLMRLLSMQIAQTDLATHHHFTQQAERYRIALVRELNYDLKDNAKYGDWDYIPKDKDFFKKNIKFTYHAPTFQQIWNNSLHLFAWLLGWSVVSAIFALIASKRVKNQLA
jgi:ABC-2 type transport system permease protein